MRLVLNENVFFLVTDLTRLRFQGALDLFRDGCFLLIGFQCSKLVRLHCIELRFQINCNLGGVSCLINLPL